MDKSVLTRDFSVGHGTWLLLYSIDGAVGYCKRPAGWRASWVGLAPPPPPPRCQWRRELGYPSGPIGPWPRGWSWFAWPAASVE